MNRLNIALASFIFFTTQLLIPTFATADPPNVVGTIPGSFSVGTDGAANYRIPLELPPGVNGLKPNLALEYDSQKGNGLLGIGWRLTGFPAITRCPTTLEQDGFIDGVDFDDNDKFCLSGKRLVAISGDYGANGTEYRTEHDSYKKIISYGVAGNGPAYFKVWYINGEIAEFGHTDDARVEARGKSDVLRWAISKIEDRFGNAVSYGYSENNETGEHYPNSISYNSTTIEFNYEKRPDVIIGYLSGSTYQTQKRLKEIITNNGVQSRYLIDYQVTGLLQKSLIKVVKQCAQVCKPATQFTWNNNELSYNGNVFSSHKLLIKYYGRKASGWNKTDHLRTIADMNGDGRADIVGFSDDGVIVAYSTGTGFTDPKLLINYFGGGLSASEWNNIDHQREVADVNGDGMADIVGFSDDGVMVSYSTGTGLTPQKLLVKYYGRKAGGWTNTKHLRKIADMNGDGRADIVGFSDDGVIVAYSTGTGFTDPKLLINYFGGGLSASEWNNIDHQREVADVNGDGMADIVGFSDDGVTVSYSTGTGLTPQKLLVKYYGRKAGGWTNTKHLRKVADMNGDGKADIVGFSDDGVVVAHSTGTGFTAPKLLINYFGGGVKASEWNNTDHLRTVTDVNGDGMADIVGFSDDGVVVSYSTGTGLTPHKLLIKYYGRKASGWNNTDHQREVADANGDGMGDIIGFSDDGVVTSESKLQHLLLEQITNGLGHTTKLTYKPLTDKTIFTKSSGSQYPVKDVQPAVYVVSEVKQANGIGGELTTQYHYKGLKRHLRGLGALGFAEISSTQVETGIKTTDHYLQDVANRKIGLLSRSQTWSATGVLLKDAQQTWQVNTVDDGDIKRFQTHLVSRETQQKSLQDEWLSTLTETFKYDDWGNTTEAKQIIQDALGQQTSTTTNTYQNNESNWLIGLATQTQATNVGVSGDSQTRTTQFSYDATTGALTQRIQEPGQGDYVLTTDFKYDSFGNLIEEQTQGAKVAARKQTYTYDAQGRFLTSTTNALGHKAQQTSDAFWGVPLTTSDANGLVTQYGYDAFGRLTSQKAPDNTQTSITRGWCNAETECPAGAVYWVKTQAQGSAPTTVYVDQLERTLRIETQALTGETQYQDTVYNALGQVEKTSFPYFKGDEVYWTAYQYDPLLRIVKTTQPDGTTSEVAYQGLNKVLTNAKGQTKTEHYNGAGQLVKVIDALGSTLSYTYDSFGNLTQTTDPDNNTVELTYDLLGRKVAMNDPDKGAWSYEYDALGRLIRQQDAKGQVTKLSYDTLDRLIKQTENAQASSKLLWRVSEFQYDQQYKGLLDQVTVDGITQQYQYDNLGRLTSETQTLFGESFTLSYSYDQYSRPLQTTFPTGLTAKQTYNEHGYLTAITDGKASNATTYWQAQGVDALGNITQQQYGNGATTLRVFDAKTGRLQDSGAYIGSTTQIEDLHFAYDELGNLTQREDKRQKIQETFAYDQLNRLTEVTAQLRGNSLTTSVQYDALGNITHKSDVGDYQYAGKCGTQQAGPHALTKTTGSQNATYCYDANGNMTSGNGRTVRYTAFDKPDQIIRGDYQINLVYGPDQKRVRRIDQGPTGTSTTYYQSGVYEKVVSDTGKIQHKHYIADVAIITKTENAGTEDGTKTNYFHRDHLDSLTAITDQNGQVVERFSYDPWGKRRHTDWQAAIDFTQITSTITKRGFTNHEHLDGVGLIHMNGRVYDPNVGRFLSADPFIQIINNIQSYNRYSYGLNNPLNGSDPTGFIWESIRNFFSGDGKKDNGNDSNSGQDSSDTKMGYAGPLRPEYQPREPLNYGEKVAKDVMDHYNEIGRGESNQMDGSDRKSVMRSNQRQTTPLRREHFGYDPYKNNSFGFKDAASKALNTVVDILGKLWNLPNTAVGLVFGGVGHIIGTIGYELGLYDHKPSFSFDNNAFQFHNNPLMPSAMTLGNVIVYGPGISPDRYNEYFKTTPKGYTVGDEERNHTKQGEVLGPLYFPAHIIGGVTSILSSPHEDLKYNVDPWHRNNFMETGPMQGRVF